MQTKSSAAAVALLLSCTALAQQTAYGQCGGIGWTGATTCVSGYYCYKQNDYYSQCIPGTATSTTTLVTATTTQKASTTVTGGTGATGGPGTTLQSGYYWVRGVESPNFHKYVQTIPQYTTGTAVLESYTTAGQFQVVDGQLVELIDKSGTLLYGNVEQRANSSVVMLALAFSKTKNTYGTFAWSGDALTWTVSSISRPNNAAWLVCQNQQLFINLGPYAYNTPAGCSDVTVHYYNDATASA